MIFGYRHLGLLIPGVCFILIATLMIASCKPNTTADNSEHVSAYFDTYNKTSETAKAALLQKMDEAFNRSANPSLANRLKFYYIKADFNYQNNRNAQTAILYLDSLIALATPVKSDPQLVPLYVKALEYKGLLFIYQHQYDQGFRYWAESKNLVTTYVKDSCSLQKTNAIPDLLFRQGRYEMAVPYYTENVRFAFACSPLSFERFSIIQNSLNSIGLSYLNLREYDSSAVYLDSAASFIAHSRRLFPENSFLDLAAGVVCNTQGYLSDARGDFEKAATWYRQSIAMVESSYPDFSLTTRLALAKLYISHGKFALAKTSLDSIMVRVAAASKDDVYRDYYALRSSYFENLKQFDSSLANFKLYDTYRVLAERKDREWRQLDIKREMEAKQAALQNSLLIKDVSLKKFQLTLAILVCAVTLLAIIFVWSHYKKSRRYVKQLELLNAEVNQSHVQLQQSFLSLEQSHSENTRLMQMVAHDLKNPLSGIRIIINAEKKRAQNEASRSSMELVSTACDNLLEVIDDLLSHKNQSAIEKKERLDLAWLLERCVALLRSKAEEKNQKILLKAQSITVLVNREKIWRVISNLLHNAIKFSEPGDDIHVTLEQQDGKLLLTIRDNGMGIPAEMGDKIFVTDQQTISRRGTMGEESHGLGLSISRNIIEEHQGSIWHEVNGNQGTAFCVSLPLN